MGRVAEHPAGVERAFDLVAPAAPRQVFVHHQLGLRVVDRVVLDARGWKVYLRPPPRSRGRVEPSVPVTLTDFQAHYAPASGGAS